MSRNHHETPLHMLQGGTLGVTAFVDKPTILRSMALGPTELLVNPHLTLGQRFVRPIDGSLEGINPSLGQAYQIARLLQYLLWIEQTPSPVKHWQKGLVAEAVVTHAVVGHEVQPYEYRLALEAAQAYADSLSLEIQTALGITSQALLLSDERRVERASLSFPSLFKHLVSGR